MYTADTAALAARFMLQEISRRASLMGSLGQLPAPRPLRPFRRRVIALPGVVEVQHPA